MLGITVSKRIDSRLEGYNPSMQSAGANSNSSYDESLDPQDWEAFRQLAHSALDDAIDSIRDVRDRPVWQPLPESVKTRLAEPLPDTPQGARETYRNFRDLIFPYPTGNIHPRFWGWVHGTGLATGLMPAILEAAMNCNCGGRDHAGLYVERCVVDWCRQMMGYPQSSSGVLVSGTSMGNIVALAVARNARAGFDVRADGLATAPKALIAYASAEAHSSITRALELLGLGHCALRKICVHNDRTIRLDALREAIETDRRAGQQPFCIVGCAGTVNTGAIDNLTELAIISRTEGLWFHVDAAFGGLCALNDSLRPLIQGIELSDSIAFDFHKWMYVQYDAGCVLVRDGNLHRQTFATRPDYLQHSDRGLAGGGEWFTDFGPELSRSFRALKIWFALKEHGAARFGRMIEKNCAQAKYLASLVEHYSDLQLFARPNLNIVCFRYRPKELDEESINTLNREIVADLQERGIAAPSTTVLDGKLAIRVAITNHRSRREDFDVLIDSVLKIGAGRVAAGLSR